MFVVITASFHSLLDPLGRDTFFHKLVRDPVKLVRLPKVVRNFKKLLLAATVPICLSLHLIRDATVDDRGPMLWENGVLDFLNVEAVVVADLLTKDSTWRISSCFGSWSPQIWFLLRGVFHLLNCATWSSAWSIVLGRCQVHLVLVCTTWLNHAWRLAHNLLVGHRLTLPWLAQLWVIGETQIELRGIQLHHVRSRFQFSWAIFLDIWRLWHVLVPVVFCSAT